MKQKNIEDQMKELTNKEVIERLKAYFMKQDHEDLCYLLASMFVDINRMITLNELPEKERILLIARMQAHRNSLIDFFKNGPRGKLKIHKFNSDELQ